MADISETKRDREKSVIPAIFFVGNDLRNLTLAFDNVFRLHSVYVPIHIMYLQGV
jgi:hypothetical protein